MWALLQSTNWLSPLSFSPVCWGAGVTTEEADQGAAWQEAQEMFLLISLLHWKCVIMSVLVLVCCCQSVNRRSQGRINVKEHLQLGMHWCKWSVLYQTVLGVSAISQMWPIKSVFCPVPFACCGTNTNCTSWTWGLAHKQHLYKLSRTGIIKVKFQFQVISIVEAEHSGAMKKVLWKRCSGYLPAAHRKHNYRAHMYCMYCTVYAQTQLLYTGTTTQTHLHTYS